ncbi:MAG: pantetheine-phosphate adenylyltransferase [Bdellovibrionales bacterium]|nr:pantetheine-phosphate adenylyltransferase [Bdellovibrionales bacterium]
MKVAIYPGFFDPFTLGHFNIVERASLIFDRVIVSLAEDSPKKGLFTIDERFSMIQESLKGFSNVTVEMFSGLLVNYVKSKQSKVLIRGIRTVSDFEYEFQMALSNKAMARDIETLFMMTEGRYSFLSSTIIKEVARLGGNFDQMVPPIVSIKLKEKYDR